MFNMTNPLWTYLIMPSLFIGLGMFLGVCLAVWALPHYRAIVEEEKETGFKPISHVKPLPRRPFDQDVD
jgi:hypothetical protein